MDSVPLKSKGLNWIIIEWVKRDNQTKEFWADKKPYDHNTISAFDNVSCGAAGKPVGSPMEAGMPFITTKSQCLPED